MSTQDLPSVLGGSVEGLPFFPTPLHGATLGFALPQLVSSKCTVTVSSRSLIGESDYDYDVVSRNDAGTSGSFSV